MKMAISGAAALIVMLTGNEAWCSPARIPAQFWGRWNTDVASCRESEPTTVFADHILLSDGELRVRTVRKAGPNAIHVLVHNIAPEAAAAGDAEENLDISFARRKLTIAHPDKNGREDPDILIRCK